MRAAGHARSAVPWSWPMRLLTWVVALAVAGTAFVLLIDTGSATTTTHEVATGTRPNPVGEPAASATEQADVAGTTAFPAQMSGSTIAAFSTAGVVGHDSLTGAEVWNYQRSDTTVCAAGTTRTTVVLVYRTGERCDQAIGLDNGTGKATWQRTFETADGNRIVFGRENLLVISSKIINVIDMGSAYQRMMLIASTPTGDDPSDTTTCEYQAASATLSIVTVLQRCRVSDSSPWKFQVLSQNEDNGQPRVLSRVDITDADAKLLGTLDDGSALIEAGASGVLVVASAGGQPYQLPGLVIPTGAKVQIVSNAGTDVVVVNDELNALAPDHRSVQWKVVANSVPQISLDAVYYLSGTTVTQVEAVTGKVRSGTTLQPAPPVKVGETALLRIVGNVVSISTPERTVTYA